MSFYISIYIYYVEKNKSGCNKIKILKIFPKYYHFTNQSACWFRILSHDICYKSDEKVYIFTI